jgi:putative spermidine/putrescine transport system substrate-binding protein
MERAEADVFVMWDFNALSYRDQTPNAGDYEILIPADGSVTSGYTTLINRWAPHPAAAQLAREYIFSDAGQINLARGNARPIRAESLKLPEDVRRKLLDNAQYQAARALKPAVWTEEVKKLPRAWQREVMGA